jgi:uncharacterized LabA/DUF88 family protein
MSRVAVFVDAGYLFAQGSAALFGSKRSRTTLSLNETAALAELTNLAQTKSGGNLLRVYWYDGALGSKGLTAEHNVLAYTDHVKLRLGFMNSRGQQKGVDSLIVTDLIELARNRAIDDALLLSGDEDVRIGVQIAQSFGVRVHLLGIVPSRGSQSQQLIQEADTTSEWDVQTVAKFLSAKPSVTVTAAPLVPPTTAMLTATATTTTVVVTNSSADMAKIEKHVQEAVTALDPAEVDLCYKFWGGAQKGIPYGLDGKVLVGCRSELGRDLAPDEKRFARKKFEETLRATRQPGAGASPLAPS